MAYKSLSTTNLPDPAIDPAQDVEPRDYFETFLYTGNGAGLQVGDVIKKPADTIDISNSLIFNDDDSAYLSRTPTLGDSRKKFTFSAWLKIGSIADWPQTEAYLFSVASGSDNTNNFYFKQLQTGQLRVSGYSVNWITTDSKLVDSSRWYHVVLACDSDASSGERIRIYVDGIEVSHSETDPSSGQNFAINMAAEHRIGQHPPGYNYPWGGAMAEIHFLDGYQEGPTAFGTFDANGIWIPQTPSVTYGTNGFHLDFSDNSNTTTLGEDQAGSNDWTLNNFALTDQVSDSPTDNFATLDPAFNDVQVTYSEGNLKVASSSSHSPSRSTIGVKSGKWYVEGKALSSSTNKWSAGILDGAITYRKISGTTYIPGQNPTNVYSDGDAVNYYASGNDIYKNGSEIISNAFSSALTTNDILQIAFDVDTGEIWYGINNSWNNGTGTQGTFDPNSPDATFTVRDRIFVHFTGESNNWEANFGQKDFAYTPPSGFLALSEDNITVDDQNLESPDLVWIKTTSHSYHHALADSVRGVTSQLSSSSTAAESLQAGSGVISFNTNGFTLGTESAGTGSTNSAGVDYVAWCWKAGTLFSNDESETSIGTVDSNGSVNTESGFSIVRFNSGASGTQSFKHGLTQRPDLCIFKEKDSGGSGDHWVVWEGVALNPAQSYGYLNLSNSFANDALQWSNTAPTDSIFTYNSGYAWSTSQEMIAYCFHSVEGYSKIGSYTGGSDPFVYLGFEPAMIIFKRATGTATHWAIRDNVRKTYNPNRNTLYPSKTDLEYTGTAHDIDFLSNGFKIRNGDGLFDASATYIYAAWAKTPFKYGTGV